MRSGGSGSPSCRACRAPGRRPFVAAPHDAFGRKDVETAALLVSELVTNVVVHAGTPSTS